MGLLKATLRWILKGRNSITLVVVLIMLNAASADTAYPDGDAWLESINDSIKNISTEELQGYLQNEPDVQLIDVRLMEEVAFQGGTIKGGARTHVIPRGWLEFRIGDSIPDTDTPIVVYCSTNRRSPLAAYTLAKMGYTNVQNYADGFLAWQESGLSVSSTDEAVGSQLYRRPVKVAEGVYSAIGATAPPTYENSGHNNNLSFIISDDGVLVVNAGDNYLLAQSLHQEIKQLTNQPVKYVVLENGQGHAMLGMNYWQEQGAEVIAHADAAHEIELKGEAILPAHSPGDIVVWLPDNDVVISGDLAFHERLLPVFEDTDTAGWIDTWPAFEALGASIVVPGHGHPTNIKEVETWTIGYLQFMRKQISDLLDNGGSLIEAYKIDQSAYSHLDTFYELAGLNADRIFRSMEFE